jgi:hypothetical protein
LSTKTGRPKTPIKQNQKKQNQQRQAQQSPQSQQPRPALQAAPTQSQLDQAAKREARMERQAAARAAGERRRRKQAMQRYAIITAVLIVLLGGATALLMRELNKPGQSVAAMPVRNHLGPGELYAGEYNSDPPTSGPHSEQLPQFKVYTEPITKELQLHGLEDGGVMIHYKPDLDKATVDRLAGLATSYIERGPGGGSHVLMAPYPNLSHPIVLTAWRRIDRLDVFDEARIRRFVDEYVGIDHHEGSEGRRIP